MLSYNVLRDTSELAARFSESAPFRHVVIENFFEPQVAESLLEQFPPFREENARNEMGRVGKKAVVQDLHAISPFYGRAADYLASGEFLGAMSSITAIPGLQYDQQMFGGGTHENLHGQELDPHVDFNVLSETGWHRRLNLIVYLNKDWREEWGGSIELHSDPRNPGENRIKTFAPVFNRGIIFETNEYSWHGFPRIQLPEGRRDLSRKSLSVYLYTEDRPREEKAPPHATFYVPRPLPAHIAAGHTLSSRDAQEIRRLLTNRDRLLRFHQDKNLEDSGHYKALHDQFLKTWWALQLPLFGYVRQKGKVSGYFPEGHVGPEVETQLQFADKVKGLTLHGQLPKHVPRPMEITMNVGEASQTRVIKRAGSFSFTVRCPRASGKCVPFAIESSQAISGRDAGLNDDVREISFLLKELEVES